MTTPDSLNDLTSEQAVRYLAQVGYNWGSSETQQGLPYRGNFGATLDLAGLRSPEADVLLRICRGNAEGALAMITKTANQSVEAWAGKCASLEAERDEADRRAGAAERQLERYREQDFHHTLWNDKAKEEAGYHRNVSFDVVWKETLEKARKWDEDNV